MAGEGALPPLFGVFHQQGPRVRELDGTRRTGLTAVHQFC